MSRIDPGDPKPESPTKNFDEHWPEIQLLELDLEQIGKSLTYLSGDEINRPDRGWLRRMNVLCKRVMEALQNLSEKLRRRLTIADLNRLDVINKFGDPTTDSQLDEILDKIVFSTLDSWAEKKKRTVRHIGQDREGRSIIERYRQEKRKATSLDIAFDYIEQQVVKKISETH